MAGLVTRGLCIYAWVPGLPAAGLELCPAGLLWPIDTPTDRFLVWSMDFITDLPLSGLFNGVFIIVDKQTKWVKLIPMVVEEGKLSTSTVSHLFFDHIMRSFGVPHVVLHDRDPHFSS